MVTGLKSHAMLTLLAIAQRSANLGVTIIENVCDPVPRCPNDRGLSHCRPFCPALFDPPICYRLGPFDGKSPSASFVSAALERSREAWGSNHVQYLHFCLRGIFFLVTAV